jgi:hypothetical protein
MGSSGHKANNNQITQTHISFPPTCFVEGTLSEHQQKKIPIEISVRLWNFKDGES